MCPSEFMIIECMTMTMSEEIMNMNGSATKITNMNVNEYARI